LNLPFSEPSFLLTFLFSKPSFCPFPPVVGKLRAWKQERKVREQKTI
jgi:hypothetical protein